MANQNVGDKKPGGGDVTKAEKRSVETDKTTWNPVGGHSGPMTSDTAYGE